MTCLATAVACTGGSSPELAGLSDQVAQVGTELKIDLNGTDPDGDHLSYGFKSADELKDLNTRANLTVSPSGAGVFRWTPNAMDVGEHAFDFTVSDGDTETLVTITIDVRSAIGSATSPVFRQPLGTGTTIDLAKKKCVDLTVVIEDQDSAEVTLSMEEPAITGASLDQTDGLTATFHWCPTKEQEAENRYTLVIAASDGDNPKTVKNYLIVLRGGSGTSCPGGAPVITHTPTNESTIVGLTVDAQVTDDKGLKESPLFYYSLTPPANPPVLSDMIQLTTLRLTGTATDGVYAADVPNPVASLPAGSMKTIYYVFMADDDDDTTGNCDHSTTSQVYQMTVTSTGTANLPICATCTADSQCGTGDLCVYMGSAGASYCLQSCAAGCPNGYACSAGNLTSVDGTSALQCVPQSGSCTMPTGQCQDDTYEDNDTQTEASANATTNGPLAPGIYDLVSCPKVNPPATGSKADDDWFQIQTTADARLDLSISGHGETDLDLGLYRANGTVLSKSTSFTPDENIVKCVPAGTYYVKVNAYGDALRSTYLFDYVTSAQTCDTTCVDDTREDDDTFSQARFTATPTHTSTGNAICPNDDDWYAVKLYTGDKLTLDLTFAQSTSDQDLDFHLYKGTVDQWPCSIDDPFTCSTTRGQGTSSNEHAVYDVPAGCAAGCDYFVVVRGFDGSKNAYDVTIKVE